ncbi:aldo/keto reductase [Myroides sp. LJL116]
MDKYKFGPTELMVPKVCFGGNVFGWTLDSKESLYLLDVLYEKGLIFIDTANNYSHWAEGNSGGESEAIIGKWLKQTHKREKMVIATKVGGKLKAVERGLSPQDIKTNLEASLQRLKTDYIDIYFAHHDDPLCKQELTMHAFNDCVVQGKVSYLGASNFSAQRVQSANAISFSNGWHSYSVLQPLYNLYDREKFETEYLSMVREQNMAVMSYFPLASGFLAGKYQDKQELVGNKRADMLSRFFTPRGTQILNALANVAKRLDCSMAEVAIAWQFTREGITVPIVSVTNEKQLQSLINACSLVLDLGDLEELNLASSYK